MKIMEKLIVCRICLAKDLQMEELVNPELYELYQKLSGGLTEDMKPSVVCFICNAMLCRAYKLMVNCMKAEILLTQMISSQKVSPLKCPLMDLRIANISLIAIRNEAELIDVEIKEEGETFTKFPALQEDCKTRINLGDLEISNAVDTYDGSITSDSEDDLPLTSIKVEQRDKIHEENPSVNLDNNLKNKNSLNDKKRKLKKDIDKKDRVKAIEKKMNATPTYVKIKLSKEQQVEMLRERSRSNNYIHSPYKCDLCYKGYRDEKTYENHRQKHDERAGSHVCQICGLRYSSVKRLHTHSMVAHVTLYRCQNCDHVSHTANQARVHERWHSGYKYICKLCGREFKKPTTYLTHLRKSHPTEHVCNICGDSFAGQQGLKVHRTKSHSNAFKTENQDEPVAERFCNDCNIQFMSKEAWQRHMVTSYKHSTKTESDSVCAVCGWSGRGEERARHMSRHVRELNGRGRMPSKVIAHCQQCTASFSSRHILEAHVKRVHLGIKYNKNVVCEVCGKKCTSNASLRYHQRVHTGEKPYPCGTCDKRFADSNQLRIHTRTHTGERPYGCTACGKRFSQKPALNRHYRIHTGARPYTCELCSRSFTQSSSLKMHLRCVHSKQPSEKRRRQKPTEELKTAIDPDVS